MHNRLFSPAHRGMHATLKALRYRGVHWANNMFVVTHFDKHGTKEWLTLGKFTSADEAARCYDKHVKATDGTKAKLNFPDLTASTGNKKYYDTVFCTVVVPYHPVTLLVVLVLGHEGGGLGFEYCVVRYIPGMLCTRHGRVATTGECGHCPPVYHPPCFP